MLRRPGTLTVLTTGLEYAYQEVVNRIPPPETRSQLQAHLSEHDNSLNDLYTLPVLLWNVVDLYGTLGEAKRSLNKTAAAPPAYTDEPTTQSDECMH